MAFGAASDAPAINNWRALHLAKHFDHWRVVEKLLKGGADPFATCSPQSVALGFGKIGDRKLSSESNPKYPTSTRRIVRSC